MKFKTAMETAKRDLGKETKMSEWGEIPDPTWGSIMVGDRLTAANHQGTATITGIVRSATVRYCGYFSPHGEITSTKSFLKSIAFEGVGEEFTHSNELFNRIVKFERPIETNSETNKKG